MGRSVDDDSSSSDSDSSSSDSGEEIVFVTTPSFTPIPRNRNHEQHQQHARQHSPKDHLTTIPDAAEEEEEEPSLTGSALQKDGSSTNRSGRFSTDNPNNQTKEGNSSKNSNKINQNSTSFLSERMENPDLIGLDSSNHDGPLTLRQQFTRFRIICGKWINDARVQIFIVILIGINALMMGIATFDFVYDNPPVNRAFEIVDTIFLSIFTIELAMQLIYHSWRLFLDGWLCFDFVIILISWLFDGVQVIRAFRIFRSLRLITRIKVMKDLVVAIFSVLPKMAAISLLLFLVFYIFAVMMTQLFYDLYARGLTTEDYFSRLEVTLFTLFQIMTLDAWADIAREVMDVYASAWIPFVAFVTVSGFVIVNLLIAVICEAVANLDEEDQARLYGKDDGDSDEEEESKRQKVDILDQVDTLQLKVTQLAKMQARTMESLRIVQKSLRVKQQRQRSSSSSSKAVANKSNTRTTAESRSLLVGQVTTE